MLDKPVLLTLTLIVSGLAKYCFDGPCGLGHFYNNTSPYCFRCPNGSYMFLEGHSCPSCFRCQKPRQDEDDISNCNSSSNKAISCKLGYFVSIDVHEERYCDVCKQCLAPEKKDSPCDDRNGTHCSSNTTSLLPSDQPRDVTLTPKLVNVTFVPEINSTDQIVNDSSTRGGGSKDSDDSSNAESDWVTNNRQTIIVSSIAVAIITAAACVFIALCCRSTDSHDRQPVPGDDPDINFNCRSTLLAAAPSNCAQMPSCDGVVCV